MPLYTRIVPGIIRVTQDELYFKEFQLFWKYIIIFRYF